MVMRVNQVAAEFRKVSNKQMAETTKRTIRENVSINAQLGKMSDKTMELIQVLEVASQLWVSQSLNHAHKYYIRYNRKTTSFEQKRRNTNKSSKS